MLADRGWPVTPQAVAAGFEKAFIPARMEVISQQPLVLLDGGHNPGCSQALRQALEEFVPQRKVAIMGVMADKDSRGELQVLGPLFSQIVTVAPEGHRAMPAQQLAQIAQEFCPKVVPAAPAGRPCRGRPRHEAGRRPHRLRLLLPGREIREMLKGKLELMCRERLGADLS